MSIVKFLMPVVLLFSITFAVELRVPAEWEKHEATWMQWPDDYDRSLRLPFSQIIKIVQQYERVHLIVRNIQEKKSAKQFLKRYDVDTNNITWHTLATNNAWLRDNGPVYVKKGKEIFLYNFGFDAWGGNFGNDVEFLDDDKVPNYIAKYLDKKVIKKLDYILERGNLEFNGEDILVLNWDCQDDRNPNLSQDEHEAILKESFGVKKIIWAYGHHPDDGTTGHIDGTARFINKSTLVITDYDAQTERDLAREAKKAGLIVKWYPGDPNWLVGNGYVIAMSDGDESFDRELEELLSSYFPNRDVYMIDGSAIAKAGGGIHCLTNDQPK